jgi:hypothetical protein
MAIEVCWSSAFNFAAALRIARSNSVSDFRTKDRACAGRAAREGRVAVSIRAGVKDVPVRADVKTVRRHRASR